MPIGWRLATSHRRTCPSVPVVTSVLSFGLTSTLETEPACAQVARREEAYVAGLAARQQQPPVPAEAGEGGEVLVDAQAGESPARSDVEHVDRAGEDRHGDLGPVGADCSVAGRSAVEADRRTQGSDGAHVPEPQRPVLAGARQVDRETVLDETAPQKPGQPHIIFDDQHAHGRSVTSRR